MSDIDIICTCGVPTKIEPIPENARRWYARPDEHGLIARHDIPIMSNDDVVPLGSPAYEKPHVVAYTRCPMVGRRVKLV